ncbi:MAG: DUF3703 domain-containing protein [Rubrivivax sp.]|nr:MAG: DUF3703 domain-containing protein [Rubrivivax sp.]
MTRFARRIAPHVDHELAEARRLEDQGAWGASFAHLQRAHVLGQASTFHHVRVHCGMLAWAVRHHDRRETSGQLLRIVGAATKTVWGWVPSGNTGGANVSPFKPMPLADDLARLIGWARGTEASL